MSFSQKLSRVPNWVKGYTGFFAATWLAFFLMRFVFLFVYRAAITAEVKTYLLQSFYIGAKFDARLAAFLALPLGLYLFIKSIFPKIPAVFNKIMASLYTVILTGAGLVYAGDFGHYSYLGLRVNASLFKYLENAFISFEMVWQTYPVVWASLGFILLMFLAYKYAMFFIKLGQPASNDGWKKKTSWFLILFVLTFGVCYGQINQYPLRWSNAYFSSNNFISNLTLNPVLNIYDTYRFAKEDSYNIEAVKKYYPIMAEYLGVDNPDINTLNFKREVKGKDLGRQFNIVVIFMESFAWNKSSFSNTGKFDTTPNAKALAEQSILFTQFYTPTSATARAVFAALSSIPDVSSFKTSSRNPLIVNQNLIANELEGYDKFFFIGGSASWGNIRGILSHNLDGLQLYEEEDYESKRVDVWGISDWDLFIEADKVLAKQERPFFAVIQTAGYHRPYTIPPHDEGFKLEKDISYEDLVNHSFGSIEEFNSLRFSDYALGEFFRRARKSPYYKDTVFVIFGDHGLDAPKSENMPRGYVEYNLINHHVPLIIHAPALSKGRVVNKTASQVDIMPTVAGLIGAPYETVALGRDVLDPKYKEKEGALVFGWSKYPPTISFVSGEYLYHDQTTQKGLYKFGAKDYNKDLAEENPELYKKMEDLSAGIYETSRYMLYNNPKKEKK
ncbi:Alkaline phosphatase superfamily [Elusimicrobium minutum Pei191]|uniref:Alkaline phosphatase superfamily n=1 Tax=Elusimicrobium minutum (strain Pei191) TaxID=445932 RepID=B2KBB2_ELUMP|nr:alkaline phosphatase family protein [Elusimicrobium minutum]ACC97934.1 Alkaline phosphatase superfamily [Elusimicrobium minutum Pei191]